jgi:hypothetical protein
MPRKTNDKPIDSAPHPFIAEFWVFNTTLRRLLASSRQNRLTIKEIGKHGRMFHLTAAGNLKKWLLFALKMKNLDAVLVRSCSAAIDQ